MLASKQKLTIFLHLSKTVIHFVSSPEEGLVDIPKILKGEAPSSGPKCGTGNYAELPKALVIGAKYDDAWIMELRDKGKEIGGIKPLPLLKPDLQGAQVGLPSVEKAKAAAERALKVLTQLKTEGKLNGEEKGIFLF